MLALATIEDVQTVTGIPVALADEDRVNRLLEYASDVVRAYTGQTITAVAADNVIVRLGDGDLILPQRPVTAVTSISINGAALNVAEYRWTASGHVYRTPFGWYGYELPWYGLEATIVYNHGYVTVPDWLVQIVASMVAEALARVIQAGNVTSTSETVGTYSNSVTYSSTSSTTSVALSPSAKELLRRLIGRPRAGYMTLAPVTYGARMTWNHR